MTHLRRKKHTRFRVALTAQQAGHMDEFVFTRAHKDGITEGSAQAGAACRSARRHEVLGA